MEFFKSLPGFDATDEAFTFMLPGAKEQLTFNITKIKASPRFKLLPVSYFVVDRAFALTMPQNKGIERHRVLREMERIKLNMPDEPVLFVAWEDGTHILIDGNNRYYAHAAMAQKNIAGKIIPKGIWQKHMHRTEVLLTPQELMTMSSGL